MKYSLTILILLLFVGCNQKDDSVYWNDIKDFNYCHDKLSEYRIKELEKLATNDIDSVFYYAGKAAAFYEMEDSIYKKIKSE